MKPIIKVKKEGFGTYIYQGKIYPKFSHIYVYDGKNREIINGFNCDYECSDGDVILELLEELQKMDILIIQDITNE